MCGFGYPCYVLKKVYSSLIRILLLLLLSLKLDGANYSWFIVSIPCFLLMIAFSWSKFLTAAGRFISSNHSTEENAPPICVCCCWGACSTTFGLALLILIFLKADGMDLSTFEVFIPLYIVLAIMLFICGLCIPCGILAGRFWPKRPAEDNTVWAPYDPSESTSSHNSNFNSRYQKKNVSSSSSNFDTPRATYLDESDDSQNNRTADPETRLLHESSDFANVD